MVAIDSGGARQAHGRGQARRLALVLAAAFSVIATLAAAALAGGLPLPAPPGAAQPPPPSTVPDAKPPTPPPVDVVSTRPEQHTLVRRLPISRRPAGKPRSVMSLPLNRLGRLQAGRLVAGGELQVTVCLRPNFAHRSRRGDCVGRLYGYDPRISAYLALARSRDARRPRSVTRLTPTTRLTCKQRQPNRNHHCVIAIPADGIKLPRARAADCALRDCFVNLIARAHHRQARSGESVVVGGIDETGRIDNKGMSRLFAAHLRPAALADPPRTLRGRRLRSRLPVAPENKGARMRVVRSQRIAHPRPGEVLLVAGRYAGRIGALPYNTRTRTAIVLADSPRSTRHSGPVATRAASLTTRIGEESNFNCTQGPSGHSNPCPILEQGVMRFGKRAGRAVYVNLIAGHGAIGAGAERHHGRRHRVGVGRGGYLKVRRFSP